MRHRFPHAARLPRPISLPFLLLTFFSICAFRSAFATPAAVTALAIQDVDGRIRILPDPRVAVLLIYEDRKAGGQNRHIDPLLIAVRRPENASKVELLPIAVVESYDFWPAHSFVVKHIRGLIAREKLPIYCDWNGTVRRTLGMARSRSLIALIDSSGKVRFAASGPLSPAQEAALAERLTELGAEVLPPATATAAH